MKLLNILSVIMYFFLIAITANAQTLLKGKIIDSLTNEVLPFVSIGIYGTNKGTMSNEQGLFVLPVKELPTFIQVFSIGYERKTIELKNSEANVVVRLKPLQVTLNEITIKPGEAERIFFATYEKLKKGSKKNIVSKSFFRLLTKNNEQYSELIESYLTPI